METDERPASRDLATIRGDHMPPALCGRGIDLQVIKTREIAADTGCVWGHSPAP